MAVQDLHKDDEEKAKGLSKRQLKSQMCWKFSKGKCAVGNKCKLLHIGKPKQDLSDAEKAEAAKLNKEKRQQKKEDKKRAREDGDGAEGGAKKAKPGGDWVCPGCGNKNWARRTVCNGAVCGTSRPGDDDFQAPMPKSVKLALNKDSKRNPSAQGAVTEAGEATKKKASKVIKFEEDEAEGEAGSKKKISKKQKTEAVEEGAGTKKKSSKKQKTEGAAEEGSGGKKKSAKKRKSSDHYVGYDDDSD